MKIGLLILGLSFFVIMSSMMRVEKSRSAVTIISDLKTENAEITQSYNQADSSLALLIEENIKLKKQLLECGCVTKIPPHQCKKYKGKWKCDPYCICDGLGCHPEGHKE